jgi:hypothetical protein
MRCDDRPGPDLSLESLEARLRALPQPAVPPDLDVRLLAQIPARRPILRTSRFVWLSLVGAAAAACFLAVLASLERDGDRTDSERTTTPSRPTQASAGLADAVQPFRFLDRTETSPFTWPLEETAPLTASSRITADLLD